MHEMAVAARVVAHLAAFDEAVATGRWAAFVGRFTEDAVMSFPDLPVPEARGRDAIHAAYVANPPDDTMVATGAVTDGDTDEVEVAWSRGGTGRMRITWEGDLVAALEVRSG
ncbi:nuclear transport factor 2 family protein [Nocardioides guangzhouensis]|uniref:Nuclear transport factor 2 family protein n=1 Tax=Nocardioides guangzhouensis TaxID=2497878 RepID=A0A4Q4ZFW4_9ACTN|nr:nuclear transport factor 2 family protein [Nocardioides guangzhouensis]RYP86718.1 nuclear transport factor 2 family protein [Nocardioides guangzhouensis]